MKIHCIRHEPFEGLACIENWIKSHNHKLTFTLTHLHQTFSSEIDFDLLIIMGGTASIYNKTNRSWLDPEKRFVQRVMKENKKILGICLGAQILAYALGADVYKGKQKEIGWYNVNFHRDQNPDFSFLPERIETFHWHGDTFEIPDGAKCIASSEITPNQGFVMDNNIIALQFHLEMTVDSLQKLTRAVKSDLKEEGKFIQSSEQILSRQDLIGPNNVLIYDLLDFLAKEDQKLQSEFTGFLHRKDNKYLLFP